MFKFYEIWCIHFFKLKIYITKKNIETEYLIYYTFEKKTIGSDLKDSILPILTQLFDKYLGTYFFINTQFSTVYKL